MNAAQTFVGCRRFTQDLGKILFQLRIPQDDQRLLALHVGAMFDQDLIDDSGGAGKDVSSFLGPQLAVPGDGEIGGNQDQCGSDGTHNEKPQDRGRTHKPARPAEPGKLTHPP